MYLETFTRRVMRALVALPALGLLLLVGFMSAVGFSAVLAGATSLAVTQRTFGRFLLAGLGLPALIVVTAVLLRLSPADMALTLYGMYAGLFAPVALGGIGLYGGAARFLVRIGVWALLAVAGILATVPAWVWPGQQMEYLLPFLWTLIAADGLHLLWLYPIVPGARPDRPRLFREALVALCVAGLLMGAGWVMRRAAEAEPIATALAVFRERHPDVRVGRPRVEHNLPNDVVVHLPTEGWTYRVTLGHGQVLDDGVAQRKAASVAADWARARGETIRAVRPEHVFYYQEWRELDPGQIKAPAYSAPAPGTYLVLLFAEDGESAGRVVINGDQVTESNP